MFQPLPFILSFTLIAFASTAPAQVENSFLTIAPQSRSSDNSLAAVRQLDGADAVRGTTSQVSAAEHLRRGQIYLTNRAFAEARTHFQAIIERFPYDTNVPAALLALARSYYVPRMYDAALPIYERLARDYPQSKEGREGFNNSAATLLRLGRAAEAAARYREYTEKYPQGERIESAYLNIIDSYREAGDTEQAIDWIEITRRKFAGTITDTNALFSRLRLDISTGDWTHAVATADELRNKSFYGGVQTNFQEVSYLRAYALERAGRTEEAINSYFAIPDSLNSYYGSLATAHLQAIPAAAMRPALADRIRRVRSEANSSAQLYPAPFQLELLRAAARQKVDPRLLLAIMRQESGFRPLAKSPASARGLLQLTIDAALKYSARAGLRNLSEDELYRPEISILVGAAYISELGALFPQQPEAVVASYNGGEDNVARWVRRASQRDAGVITSEIGYAETKDYVYKVMSNYRAYRLLYTQDLRR